MLLPKSLNQNQCMAHQQTHPEVERTHTVVLVNALDNPVAQIDDSTFRESWHWVRTGPDWKPGDPLPASAKSLDGIIVFAAKYQEEGIRQLCEAVRGLPELAPVPLLVAVDQYQMPLANRVREMPNTDFIVTPIEEKSLIANLNRAAASRT